MKELDFDSERYKPITGDTLAMYLKEIRNIPVLEREQERELAVRIQAGDKQALNQLVRSNLKYVVSVANKYRGCGLSLEDLINEGNIGLIQAAKRFDPEKGVKFITYGVWWIRQAIMHALAEQAGTVRLPIKQAGILYKIGEKYQKLRQSLGREPTSEEVARGVGLEEEEVEAVLRVFRNYLSLDSPISEADDTSHLDMLEATDRASVEEDIIKNSLAGEMAEILQKLPPREQQILRMRFGFDGEPMTLEEIGKKMGLSRERIRQIEKKAKRRLKASAKSKALRDYLN